jgi:hypothetical protein
MPFATSPAQGTIVIQPLVDASDFCCAPADDSTLDALFHEFAHEPQLIEAAEADPPRLVAAARLSGYRVGSDATQTLVRADLARLLDDLQAEYEDLAARLV